MDRGNLARLHMMAVGKVSDIVRRGRGESESGKTRMHMGLPQNIFLDPAVTSQ